MPIGSMPIALEIVTSGEGNGQWVQRAFMLDSLSAGRQALGHGRENLGLWRVADLPDLA